MHLHPPPTLHAMHPFLRFALCGILLSLATAVPAPAQEQATPPATGTAVEKQDDGTDAFMKSIDWKTEGTGSVGNMASLKVPEGYRFTGGPGTVKLMKAFGNLTNGDELAYISPLDMSWFAVFEFEDSGYVKDDEKNKLDADAILEQLKEGQLKANSQLSSQGMTTLTVLGWQKPPFYNPATHNLEWAIRLQSSDGSQVVNYKTKVLGRRGVMDVVLVCGEEQLATVVPEYQKLLTGFGFNPSENYASYKKGDKIAEYGLTGLIVGGGLLVAAKSGLLAKLFKPILIGLLAVGAFIKRILTGKKRDTI